MLVGTVAVYKSKLHRRYFPGHLSIKSQPSYASHLSIISPIAPRRTKFRRTPVSYTGYLPISSTISPTRASDTTGSTLIQQFARLHCTTGPLSSPYLELALFGVGFEYVRLPVVPGTQHVRATSLRPVTATSET